MGLHDEVNRAALLAGKKVYCEKPLSLTSSGAREIALLAEEKGIPVGEGPFSIDLYHSGEPESLLRIYKLVQGLS